MIVYVAAVLVGVVLLARCADVFVEGAAELSFHLGLPAVLIGAVVIGFGTSAPELVVSGIAAAQGAPDVGVGNIVGSNVANLTLVLGIAGLVGGTIAVSSSTIRREVPLTIGSTVVFGWFVQGGLTRLEGAVLWGLLALILGSLLRSGRRGASPDRSDPERATPTGTDPARTDPFQIEASEVSQEVIDPGTGPRGAILRTVLGLLGVLAGAQGLVFGASRLADEIGLSGGFVGMTVVALGTSMPEIVTSARAASRGHSELVVGNLLGSTMFNALAVGGLVALLAPGPVGDRNLTVVGVLAAIAASLIALVFMSHRRRITRPESGILVVLYLALLPFLA